MPNDGGYARVLSGWFRPTKARSAWNQSFSGDPIGQPRFSHNSYASVPIVSWSGLMVVRLACDPATADVFRISFPCLDIDRGSIQARLVRNSPLLRTFHLACKWPPLRLPSTTSPWASSGRTPSPALSRFVFNLKLHDGDCFLEAL